MLYSLRRLLPTVVLVMFMVLPMSCLALKSKSPNAIFQLSTISALVEGVYDGSMTVAQMRKKGDFGVGTFAHLNGELVVLDGTFYHIDADGKAQKSQHNEELPLAIVTFFSPETTIKIDNVKDYKTLQQVISDNITNHNIPYAIRVKGKFAKQFVRSMKPQLKPYKPIEVAVKEQTEIKWENVDGDMVGFWFPEYFKNVSIPGFHFHFIDQKKLNGGHVLDVAVEEAEVFIQPIHDFTLGLPENEAFRTADFKGDYSKVIQKVEKQPKA